MLVGEKEFTVAPEYVSQALASKSIEGIPLGGFRPQSDLVRLAMHHN